jgi:autotransporter-associated beta strand protein
MILSIADGRPRNQESQRVGDLLPGAVSQNATALIGFLEQYYEYLNTVGLPSNVIQNITAEHDIDRISASYLDAIQAEIANNIPNSKVIDRVSLYKKIVKYYSIRGTSQSAVIFFRIFFDEFVELLYPKDYLFKTSDGSGVGKTDTWEYTNRKGFVSDQNKIQDGYFWQDYSYAIRSALSLSDYEKQYLKLVHPAGLYLYAQLLLLLQRSNVWNNAIDYSSDNPTLDLTWLSSFTSPRQTDSGSIAYHSPKFQPGWLSGNIRNLRFLFAFLIEDGAEDDFIRAVYISLLLYMKAERDMYSIIYQEHLDYIKFFNPVQLGDGYLGVTVQDVNKAYSSISPNAFTNNISSLILKVLPEVWIGLGSDNNWSTPENWSNGFIPSNNNRVLFGGTTRLFPYNDISSLELTAIRFNNSAGSFSISGNEFTQLDSSAIANNSSNPQTISNDITLGAGANGITVDCNTSDILLSGVISGSNQLIKTGAGTLTLSAVDGNTYTGDTTVNQGTLKIGDNEALGTSTTLYLSAGTTLDLNGTALSNNAGAARAVDYSGGGSKIINSGGDISTTNRNVMYTPSSGDIWSQFDDSAGGVISLRLGHMGVNTTLRNLNNKIRGKIVLTGGSLTTVYNMASGSFGTGAIEVGNGNANQKLQYLGTDDVDISDRDIYLVGNGGTGGGMYLENYGTGALTLGDVYAEDNTVSKAFRISGDNTGDNTVSGVIRNANTNGTVRVEKHGTGKWILSGANTYTGTTTVTQGTLAIGANNVIPTASAVVVTGSTSILDIGTYNSACGVVSLKSNGSINGTTGTLTGTSYALEFGSVSAKLGGVGASLTKSAASTVFLRSANTYTGDTNVNAGILELGGNTGKGSLNSLILNMGGGRFNYTRTGAINTQSFTTTKISAGASLITGNTSGATLDLGVIEVTAGASVNFGPNQKITTASNNLGVGILGGYATYSGYSAWARKDATSGFIVGLTNGYLSTAGAPFTDKNIDVESNVTFPAGTTLSTIRFISPPTANHTLTLDPSGTTLLKGNGILCVSAVATRQHTITGGQLAAKDDTLYIVQNNNAAGSAITIESVITDNGASSIGLAKAGSGNVVLTAANTYTGSTAINIGTLTVVKDIATAAFTPTALQVTFSTPPTVGQTYKFFPGSTVQTYTTITLIGASGLSATYNSSNSTLTIT